MTKYIFLIFILFSTRIFGQGYKIELNLEAAANKEIQLAHHYLGKIYVDDTTHIDARGIGILKGDSLLHQGLYKIYLDGNNHFDFLLGADQQFSLSNKTFAANTMEVKGSTDTEEFVKYIVYLDDMRARSNKLRKELDEAPEDNKQKIQENLEKITEDLHDYWAKTGKKYPDLFISKFMVANYVQPLDVTNLPKEVQNNDSLLLLARFKYQHDHYWDNFDYTDERFLYTPFYKPKLETWYKNVLYPAYDSVKPEVYQFLEDIKPNKRIFQYATSYFLNSSINSNIVGMDALFVDLAKDFYLSGEAFWTSEESLKKIRENVLFMENNLIGKTAPDLTMENVDGEFYNLHQIESKVTVVLIYEPNCSHCKVFVPEFYKDVYLPYKDKGLEVFAIYTMDNKEEWTEFLTKNDMYEWINVWDKHHVSRFKILYDARKTPGVFVLDENKKIITKNLTNKQLKKLIQEELG
ncbi:MAG: redoxin domain-containing protein [Bacteroidota bacterium]